MTFPSWESVFKMTLKFLTSKIVLKTVKYFFTQCMICTCIEEVSKLTKNYMLVLWGGTNDVSKNNSTKGLTQEINYLRSNQQTNSIVITVPHRFDLDYNSCVNTEVKMYNRRLINVTNYLNKVTLVNAVTERKYYTRHGLHLNVRGK